MTQPSGHFLGIDSRERTYLRSIPLLCAADTISVILQIAYFITSTEISFRAGFSTYIGQRFVKGVEKSETLQTLYDQTWARWVYLMLATLLPAIKLIFGLGGSPWTRIWGVMFLSSIIVTEILIFFGSWQLGRMASHDNAEASGRLLRRVGEAEHGGWPAEPLRLATLYTYPDGLSKKLKALHIWITAPAFLMHFGLLLWAAWDLKSDPHGVLGFLLRIIPEIIVSFEAAFTAVIVGWFLCWPLAIFVWPILLVPAFFIAFASGHKVFFYSVKKYKDDFMIFSSFVAAMASYFYFLWRLTRRDLLLTFKWTIIHCSFLLAVSVLPFLLSSILYRGREEVV